MKVKVLVRKVNVYFEHEVEVDASSREDVHRKMQAGFDRRPV